MQSTVLKRSIVVAGHKTSVSLEDAFWNGLKEIGVERHMTLSDLVAAIDAQRQHGNLSSAIRLFVLDFYRAQLSEAKDGDKRAHEMTAHTARRLFLMIKPHWRALFACRRSSRWLHARNAAFAKSI